MNNPAYLLKRYLEAKTEAIDNIILFSKKTATITKTKDHLIQENTINKNDNNKTPNATISSPNIENYPIPDYLEISGNTKNTLTIINSLSPEYKKLNKEATLLLQKILKSVDIDYKNINIITLKENLLHNASQEHKNSITDVINCFSPKVICLMGNFTSSIMLNSDDANNLRGKLHNIENIQTVVTLSPRYIVATEAKTSPDEVKPEKMKVWQDMKIIKKLLA